MTGEPDDIELLEAWRRGDDKAGTLLVRRHFDSLLRFFKMRLDDEFADLVQRTFTAAVESRDRIIHSTFRAYLFGIAHKLLLMELRTRGRARVRPGPVEAAAASSDSPSKVVLQHEEQRLLLNALRGLPLQLQALVQLYYWEELGTAEIAEVVGIPAGTVKSRLFRARQLLESAISSMDASAGVRSSTLTGFEGWAQSVRDAFASQDSQA